MKKMIFKSALLTIAGVGLMAGSAIAAPIFSDNFNTENEGTGTSNYDSFNNWDVDLGSVDLVGGGYWDQLAFDGLSIDLDGSTKNAGRLTSNEFAVTSGQTYTLSFDIAGNQREGLDDFFTVQVWISSYFETFTLSATDAWQTITREFTAYGPDNTARIIFNHDGSDNVGALLDNVSVDTAPVPEPATMLLFGTGLAGLAGFSKRKKNKKA